MTTMDNDKPNLRLVSNYNEGVMYVGAKEGIHIRGSDLYIWENDGKDNFVGVHMPNIKPNSGLRDGMVKLADLVRIAYSEGCAVVYEPPREAKKQGYRALDDAERLALRTARGLPDLKLAA
jgi:hypothetical protein